MSGYQGAYGAGGCAECGAHSIRVDRDDNVWVVDATAHAVYRLDAQGRIAQTLGTPGQAGQSERNFYLPTDVAFAPNGDVLVSDGYGNARVVRFSRDGRYLAQFGSARQRSRPVPVAAQSGGGHRAGFMSATAKTSGS